MDKGNFDVGLKSEIGKNGMERQPFYKYSQYSL
jgi:hypothetical protein